MLTGVALDVCVSMLLGDERVEEICSFGWFRSHVADGSHRLYRSSGSSVRRNEG